MDLGGTARGRVVIGGGSIVTRRPCAKGYDEAMTLEIVAQSSDDALAAERAGADRLELVSALSLGGLTSSFGALEETLSACDLPVVAMLRPRSGGFAYGSGELAAMIRDGERFLAAGAQGLVFGVLNPEGKIDAKTNARLVKLGGEAVFHRAFDLLSNSWEALERLIDLGFQRVLTSGGPGAACDNLDALAHLVERADGRIEILAGGGIRAANVREIVERTGVGQVHLAALEWAIDPSATGAAFNEPPHPEDRYGRVDESTVAAVRRGLKF